MLAGRTPRWQASDFLTLVHEGGKGLKRRVSFVSNRHRPLSTLKPFYKKDSQTPLGRVRLYYLGHMRLFTNGMWKEMKDQCKEASPRWPQKFWDTAWQLARWRWFMVGQESHRWMGRRNVNQICSLTTQESTFSVRSDRWKWPKKQLS